MQPIEKNFFAKLKRLVSRQRFRRKVPDNTPFAQTGQGQYVGHMLGTNRIAASLYEHNLQANADRIGRLRDYELMDSTPIVSTALNVYADDACSYNEDGQILTINSDNEKIKDELEFFFKEIVNIDFNIYHWIRTLCKTGDEFLLLAVEPEKGIQGIISLPTAEIEREEAYDGDPNSIRFRWLNQTGEYYEDYQIAHFRLIGDDHYLPYGRSILESGRRAWKQMQLLEDAMLIYRISRAAEKRVFKIETANLPPDQVGAFLKEQRDRVKTESLVNPMTGEIDLRYRSTAITDDFWFAKRGDMGSTVETLPGGQRINDQDDLLFIQQQLITSLGCPKIYLQFDEDLGNRSAASKEDIRFARTIQRIQKIVISELSKIAIIHLFALKKYDEKDITNFELKLYNPSTIMELGKLELMEKRLDIYEKAVNQSRAFSVYKGKTEILHMSDSEILEEDEKIVEDRKKEAKLKLIEEPSEFSMGQNQDQDQNIKDEKDDDGIIEKELDDNIEAAKNDEPNIGRNNSIKQSTPSEFRTENFYLDNSSKRKLLEGFQNKRKTDKKLAEFFGFESPN